MEIGVNTFADYLKRGYAKCIGFRYFADMLTGQLHETEPDVHTALVQSAPPTFCVGDADY